MVIIAVNASIMIIVIRDCIKRKQIETYAKHLFRYQMKNMLIADKNVLVIWARY